VRNGVSLDGAHVVIVGRSNIVGKPLALILMQKGPGANATVTVCHSRSRDLAGLTRGGDVVVVAIGQPLFLKADMVRPGAVVVDVGTTKLPDGRWAGDVDFEAVREVASAITPVPGGVGPMTITMLLQNTLRAAQLQVGLPPGSSRRGEELPGRQARSAREGAPAGASGLRDGAVPRGLSRITPARKFRTPTRSASEGALAGASGWCDCLSCRSNSLKSGRSHGLLQSATQTLRCDG